MLGNNPIKRMHKTATRGPGDILKEIASKKPKTEINNPKIADLTIATHKDGACCRPNKAGVESKAITRITPTADIELTMTRAVAKPRARFNLGTSIPFAEAPSGSNPP